MSRFSFGWSSTTLAECADWYSGGTPDTSVPAFWNGDIPWITSSSLHNFYLTHSERQLTKLGLENGSRLMPENTIIFVVRGMSLKTEFRLGITRKPVAFGQDCKALIAKSGIDPWYLAYAIKSKSNDILGMVDEAGHGTGRLQTEVLKQIEISVPPLSEQIGIARSLRLLDDKIELNRRMNRTLEAMAQAVFCQWFVENEEVETWEVGDIYRIAEVIYGAPFSSALFNDTGKGLPLIRIRDLSDHNPEIFTDEIHPNRTVIKAGDVIVGMDGEFRVHHWRGPDALLNQRMCLFKPKNGVPKIFVAEAIREHLEFFERAKVGTTVIHLGKSDIDTFKIVLPPRELLIRFGQIANPILDKIVANEKESRTLATLSDTLLPKLMRGEVRVSAL